MDTTPEYIKMCEEATEIQEAWKPKEWDYYSQLPDEDGEGCVWLVLPESIADSGVYGRVYIEDSRSDKPGTVVFDASVRDDYIWLLRQDQLVELMWPGFKMRPGDPAYIIDELAERTKGKKRRLQNRWRKFSTIEQLYLAMVMQYRHNKRWVEEDWVNGRK